MKWVRDLTGKFVQRPHYEQAELDAECEALVTAFMQDRRGSVEFPIATDDLIVLLEREAADVDIYADLSDEGTDVEGVTYFRASGKPDVKIAKHLAEDGHSIHRFRTTATHELGHVKFHNVLWAVESHSELLFPEEPETERVSASPRCRRQTIQPLSEVDWMEWQAGYACGAFLMPLSYVTRVAAEMRSKNAWLEKPHSGSDQARELIAEVAGRFDTSADAARIRLTQLGQLLTQPQASGNLFGELR